jgi:hypothetical protein
MLRDNYSGLAVTESLPLPSTAQGSGLMKAYTRTARAVTSVGYRAGVVS